MFQFEKEKLSKQLKSAEQEQKTACTELEQVKGHRDKLEQEKAEVSSQQKELVDRVGVLEKDKEVLKGERDKVITD